VAAGLFSHANNLDNQKFLRNALSSLALGLWELTTNSQRRPPSDSSASSSSSKSSCLLSAPTGASSRTDQAAATTLSAFARAAPARTGDISVRTAALPSCPSADQQANNSKLTAVSKGRLCIQQFKTPALLEPTRLAHRASLGPSFGPTPSPSRPASSPPTSPSNSAFFRPSP
jgi:hypothetical protein